MIKYIITHRCFRHEFSYDLVYEWEDFIARELGLKWRNSFLGVKGFGTRILNRLNFLYRLFDRGDEALYFVMAPGMFDADAAGRHSVVPVIVDFFKREDEELLRFYKRYRGNRIVLITSREAFDFLKTKKCPLPIRHWPLSLPDKYAIKQDSLVNKKYDCVLVGRPNPVFSTWLKRYFCEHPDFVYVENKRLPRKPNCYVTSQGVVLGDVVKTRDDYMKLLRSSRVGLYSTPSMDEGRPDANGFNQVTPRFLEYVANGCHVLARYPKNADTDWYEMEKIAPHLETYEDFAKAMDYARANPVDFKMYSAYLNKHYTSVRAKQLMTILQEGL